MHSQTLPHPSNRTTARLIIRKAARRYSLATAAVLGLALPAPAQVLRYGFNEGSGSTVANSGSAGSAGDLTLGGIAGWTTGVGGAGSAYHAAPEPPDQNTYAITGEAVAELNNLSAFTITGWLNVGSWADLTVLNWADGSAGATLRLQGDGELKLNLEPWWDGNSFTSSTSGAFGEVDGWLFFAVSWDGTGDAAGKVNFYLGTEETTASLVSTMARGGATSTGASSAAFLLGQSSTASGDWWNAYQGAMDDIRVYDSALSAGAIQGIQAEAIPEPNGAAFLLVTAAAMVRCRRRAGR